MKKILLAVSAFVLLTIGSVFAISSLSSKVSASANDCDSNAVVRCGIDDGTDVKNKYNANTPKDIKAVYSRFGLTSDIINMKGYNAVWGNVHKNGNVEVGGVIVAIDAKTVGREYISGSEKILINGDNYYRRSPSVSFLSSALRSVIYLDGSGKFVGAVISACGNPVMATPKVTPPTPPKLAYECKKLSITKQDRTNFTFATTATTSNVNFKRVIYSINDASGKQVGQAVSTKISPVIKYTLTTPGKYTVTATVVVEANGKEVLAPVGPCVGSFEVEAPKAPIYQCTKFIGSPVAGKKNTYEFALYYRAEGGATLSKVNVNYGDGKSEDINNYVGFTHTYGKAGNYKVTATLDFQVNGKTESVKCYTELTVNPDHCTVPGKEGLPAGSPECYVPCEYNKAIAATNPGCKQPIVATPTKLVNTGPGEVLGLFSGTSVLGAFIHRLIARRRFLQ